ncbi:MAG: TrkH family potassium uptake protein [Lachnospiraceae bacterium]|nr:TrkH family potassium uptake protein [Lachnospiraceae bacterium 10-1]MCX4351895.1 TrkH family potassium uptake protein [Lachnospiraceae bacterium]
MKFLNKIQDKITYVRIIAVGYMTVILIGTLLLLLPPATRAGESTGILTALFTATSATCVTGLVVVDTATHWTAFGQTVILLMIQIGGLGFMTLGVLLALILRRRISLRTRGILQESMNYMQLGGVIRLVKITFWGTFLFEGCGAVLLAVRFIPVFGIAKGILYGIFHSVSAFCNAGFDLMGGYSGKYSSFVEFHGDVLINCVLMALVILGGLGFFVWSDLKKNGCRWKRYMLHTKITLFTTVLLLVAGTILYFLFENDNLLAQMSGKDKFLAALFSSVTARTAGFNTIDTGGLTGASKLLTMLLMFIGGSPGSTAGGIKTVTALVLVAYVWSNLRESKGVNMFQRRLDDDVIRKASNVVVLSMLMAVVSVIFICFIQPYLPVEDVMFEVFSAIGTVGMSTGLTRDLSTASRIVIILLMYCGRIGSMSFALSFTERKKVAPVQFPVEKIMIG